MSMKWRGAKDDTLFFPRDAMLLRFIDVVNVQEYGFSKVVLQMEMNGA